jgi:hypothetical protein
LFEKDLGGSFTKTDLKELQMILPKVIVDHLELAEKAEIHLKENKVTMDITGNILNVICQQAVFTFRFIMGGVRVIT